MDSAHASAGCLSRVQNRDARAAGFGRQLQEWPAWIHLTLACIALLINARVFVLQYDRIRANGRMIDEVMETVERMRAEHGLLSSEEALQRDET